MYYSNEDFENFYVRYKAEGLPRNISIQEFCMQNKVSWNLFNKWYRDTRHRIKEVAVTGRPEESAGETLPPMDAASPSTDTLPDNPQGDSVRIMVDIRMTNGLRVRQKGLSYRKLVALVGNLEALC